MRNRTWTLLPAGLIAAWFLWFTRDVLEAYFSPDDVTNLYRSWSYPLASLIKANLLFFLNSPFYRPLTSAWYRMIYTFAGFNPLPFHAANLLILAANLWLTYCLARRLTQSREIGMVAALLIAYLPNCGQLYFDTGFEFDVLCYLFYISALLLYVRARQQNRGLNRREIAACAFLYVCALNSKELAITLPAFLFLYELLYAGAPWRSPRELGGWLRRDGLAASATAAVMLLFTAGRVLDRGAPSLMSMGAYRPTFTWDQWMKTSANFFADLFLQSHPVGRVTVLAVWLGMFAVAWIARSRTLKFAWLFVMLTPIPVAFILPRGAPQYYVVLFGWALYAATAFVRAWEFVFSLLPAALQIRPPEARATAMLVVCGAFLFPFYRNSGFDTVPSIALEGELIRDIHAQMVQFYPRLKPGAHILFLNDPVDDDYRLLFLARLTYRDVTILVDRARAMHPPPGPAEIASADAVLDYRYGRFFNSPLPPPQGPEPAIEFEWGRPSVFHHDFQRITRRNPAEAGETVIARVSALGATTPPLAAGQLFPAQPLLNVAAAVAVRVGGLREKVSLKIGWPGSASSYRIDFQVPASAVHGEIPVQVIAGGVAGPEIGIPVE